jgi:transcriptional regulator with XRE-family HTH domain
MALRTARGITRAWVERKTGVRTRTLRLIEEGRSNPAQGTRTVLLRLFGAPSFRTSAR